MLAEHLSNGSAIFLAGLKRPEKDLHVNEKQLDMRVPQ
jgi:hypothetical protein